MLVAAAKRKRDASSLEGTSVSDAEMALRLGTQGKTDATPGNLGASEPRDDSARAALPGTASKRVKMEAVAEVKKERASFTVPPALPQADKAGSMRRKKGSRP